MKYKQNQNVNKKKYMNKPTEQNQIHRYREKIRGNKRGREWRDKEIVKVISRMVTDGN